MKEEILHLRTILDFIHEGVIYINGQGQVALLNYAAEKNLNVQRTDIIGKLFSEHFPEFKKFFISPDLSFDQIITVKNNKLVANWTPIKLEEKVLGYLITFRKVDNLLKAEQKIRKELYAKGLVARYNFSDIVGESEIIKKLISMATLYAHTDSTILITGESGTGKELFAQSIHKNSRRQEGPFVAINCAALPENLLETELFGYEEGAFTGAKKGGKQGLFELAHNGTIFLDEIGDMPISLQARLLRVIQQKEVMHIGGEKVIPINVRIIVATNQNLYHGVQIGKFREDLYYRINVLNLNLPSLRERKEDIPLLIKHFTERYSCFYNKEPLEMPGSMIDKLMEYNWPGNIRELGNFIERYVILSGQIPVKWELVEQIFLESNKEVINNPLEEKEERLELLVKVSELENMAENIIKQVYELTGKNKFKTAQLLGISRTTVWKKMKDIL